MCEIFDYKVKKVYRVVDDDDVFYLFFQTKISRYIAVGALPVPNANSTAEECGANFALSPQTILTV